MSRPKVDEMLEFLSDWKSSREVKDHFQISQNEWYNFRNWLVKGKFVKTAKLPVRNKTNCSHVYKATEEA